MRKSINKLFAAILSAALTLSLFPFVPGLFSITVNAATTNVGDVITFGKYEQDNNLSNGSEDIEWIVLDKKDGKLLLLSKYALDNKSIADDWDVPTTWETSNVRLWLNGDFYNSAFSVDEQNKISTSQIVNEDGGPYYQNETDDYGNTYKTEYYIDGGSDTEDKVFLLSVDEIYTYVGSEDRICFATNYAISNGAWTVTRNAIPEIANTFDKDSTLWWTRTIGTSTSSTCYISFDGEWIWDGSAINTMGDAAALSVRPAMWVDEQYDAVTTASTPTPEPTTPAPVVEPTTPSAPDPVLGSDPMPSVTNKDYVYLLSGVAHVQDYGDTSATFDGTTLKLGTTGQSKRVEAITIYFDNNTGYSGTLQYRVHVQDIGWMDWVDAGQMAGTSGLAKRLEGIEMQLTGDLANYYSIQYSVHIQDYGDSQGWVCDGTLAGTTGESKRLEEVRVKLVPRSSSNTTSVKYRVHVQDFGWESSWATDGSMSGTSGQSKRLEGIEIFLSGAQYSGGITYRTHIQDIGWETEWKSNGEMSGTQGQAKRLEAIQIMLTGDMANYYDVYYRVHAQNYGWLGWAKNGQSAGTAGFGYRLEAIEIVLVSKGGKAPGDTIGAFITYYQPTSRDAEALASAILYVKYLDMSYEGLYDQLRYEGYTDLEARYGISNCGADWSQECYDCACSYLRYFRMTESQLRSQLKHEKFTDYQINYAINRIKYG